MTVQQSEDSKQIDASEVYQDPIKAKKKEQLLAKKTVETKQTVDLAFAGGDGACFLGVEDLLNHGGYYTTTAQCISQGSDILALNAKEFK